MASGVRRRDALRLGGIMGLLLGGGVKLVHDDRVPSLNAGKTETKDFVAGRITSIVVTSAGSGYSSTPTITFNGREGASSIAQFKMET